MSARRIALAIVFGLLMLQGAVSLALRGAPGASDQAHPALHLASGVLGLAFSLRERPQRLFGAVFGAGYLALGLAGALGRLHLAWLPLGTADHVFHVSLGVLVVALSLWKVRQAKKARPRRGKR